MLSNKFDDQFGRDSVVQILIEHTIWPILAVIVVFTAVTVPEMYRNVNSFELILHQSVPLGLFVLAESVCLLSGNFDLSIGAIAGFSAVFTGLLVGGSACLTCSGALNSDPYLAMGVLLLIGGTIGLANGVMIAKVGVNPFLQTLAFLIIFEGAKTAMTTQPVTDLPDAYIMPGGEADVAIGTLFVLFVVIAFVMRYTSFGKSVYAVGSNEQAARAVGVNTDRVIMAVYVISGVLSALAGLMLTGYTTAVSPGIAENAVFPAFAAAVIGGVSLFGGRGRISGALGGLLLLGIVEIALTLSDVAAPKRNMANGIVLLFAILLYNAKEDVRSRILSGVRHE